MESRRRGGWSWQDGAVDPRRDYLELRYGAQETDPGEWVAGARVGPPTGRVFPVQWLIDPKDPENRGLVQAIREDLDFYLLEVGGRDPWLYAQYHCGTMANWYGFVHWDNHVYSKLVSKKRREAALKAWKTRRRKEAARKAARVARQARTMAKWLVAFSHQSGARWQLVDLSGEKAEARGVVDLLAVRKDHRAGDRNPIQRGDLLDIALIQVKGGGARPPTAEDVTRLRAVAKHHRARLVVLVEWRRGRPPQTWECLRRRVGCRGQRLRCSARPR